MSTLPNYTRQHLQKLRDDLQLESSMAVGAASTTDLTQMFNVCSRKEYFDAIAKDESLG